MQTLPNNLTSRMVDIVRDNVNNWQTDVAYDIERLVIAADDDNNQWYWMTREHGTHLTDDRARARWYTQYYEHHGYSFKWYVIDPATGIIEPAGVDEFRPAR